MKKSSFVSLIIGALGVALFALGMCMTLIPEWGMFNKGVVLGGAGLVLALINIFIWRRIEHKPPVKISGKTVLEVIIGIAGFLTLGAGMCFCMVWGKMLLGVLIGFVGIILLLCLIPLIIGLKD